MADYEDDSVFQPDQITKSVSDELIGQGDDEPLFHPDELYSCHSTRKIVANCSIKTDPFVNFSIEELSFVKDVSFWTNCNVRCIGKLIKRDDSDIFQSCSKPDEVYEIVAELSVMKKEPPLNTVVQIFGEISVTENKTPVLKGLFYRNFEGVNLTVFEEALELMRPHVPLFISSRVPQSNSDEGSDDKMEDTI